MGPHRHRAPKVIFQFEKNSCALLIIFHPDSGRINPLTGRACNELCP